MPTTFTRAHVLAALFSVAFAGAGVSACVDSFHLDPAGTGGGASASTGSASGGCQSNAECAFPKPVCDTVRHACVGCLTASDCAYEPGAVCSKGACECPGGGACGDGGTVGSGTGGSGGSSSSAGTGGGPVDGGQDAGDDGGGDAGMCDAGTCADALSMGGKPCAGSVAATDYDQLQAHAGCTIAMTCSKICLTNLCADLPPSPTCKACLSSFCAAQLAACSSN